MKESIKTFGDEAVKKNETARDDVAQIRATSNPNELNEVQLKQQECDEEGTKKNKERKDQKKKKKQTAANSQLAMRYSYVANADNTSHNSHTDSTHDFLSSAAETIGIDVSDERREYHTAKSKRLDSAINEFTDGEYAMVASFPDVFMLGTAYGKKASLNNKERLHLLLQFTNGASSNQHFLFSEFDKMQRHSNVQGMHAKVKRDPKAFAQFVNSFMKSDFQEKLKESVANPTGKVAKQVLRKIIPVLKSGGKKSAFSALDRHAAAGEILAMGRRFAAAPTFLTVGESSFSNVFCLDVLPSSIKLNVCYITTPAVDDVNSPTVFRLSFRSTSNLDWPALAPNTFFDALEDGSDYIGSGNIPINCSWPSLASAATENPVAVAMAYKKIVYDIMTILVGLRPANTSGNNNRTVKTFYKDWSKVGAIVGTPMAYIGVTETTGRGSLHFHTGKFRLSHLLIYMCNYLTNASCNLIPVVIWGGLSPELLESISCIPELCDEASKVLESMYCTSLPRELHVRDLIKKEMVMYYNSTRVYGERKKRTGRAMLIAPHPSEKRQDFVNFSHQTVCMCGIHQHCLTCRKPPKGYTGCRLAKPSGSVSLTGPVELIDTTQDDVRNAQVEYETKETVRERLSVPIPVHEDLSPFHTLDPRIIVWEVKRPKLEALPEVPEEEVLGSEKGRREWLLMQLQDAMGWKDYNSSNNENEHQCSFKAGITEVDEFFVGPPSSELIIDGETLDIYDPDKDGNCLFAVFSKYLSMLGHDVTSNSTMRRKLMEYLIKHRNHEEESTPGRDGMCLSWQKLTGMSLTDILEGRDDRKSSLGNNARNSLEEKQNNDNMMDYDLSTTHEENDMMDQQDSEENDEFDLLQQYIKLMLDAIKHLCCWGGHLEMCVFSEMTNTNIAVYEVISSQSCEGDDNGNGSTTVHLKLNESNSRFVKRKKGDCKEETDRRTHSLPETTICVIYDGSHYRLVGPKHLICASKQFLSDKRVISETMKELNAMKSEDLETLYKQVSKAVTDRNGYVADFNILLTALMGCNTNSLFLGSREQSKAAVFYIGKILPNDYAYFEHAYYMLRC